MDEELAGEEGLMQRWLHPLTVLQTPHEVDPRLKTGFDLSKLIPSLISHLGEPELKFTLLCDLDTSVSQFSCL